MKNAMDYEQAAYNEWAAPERQPPKATQERQSTGASDGQTAARNGPARVAPRSGSQAVDHGNGKSPVKSSSAPSGASQRGPKLTSQQKWLSQGAKKQDFTIREQPAPLIDIGDEDSNDGEAAWRNHQPPVDTTTAPAELGWQGQELEQISRRHGTFISTQQNTGNGHQILCGIWGEPSAVAHTKQAISDWIMRELPSKQTQGTSMMSKSKSLLPKQHMHEEKRWRREVKKQKYRQAPPLGTAFGAIATFHWPIDEYRPEEVLGRNYEALDPIRMDCACYIIFERNMSVFQLLGEIRPVKRALLRMRVICYQVAARQLTPVRMYLLHFPGESVSRNVSLTQYEHALVLDSTDEASGQLGQSPHGEGLVLNEVLKKRFATKSSRNVKHIQQCLANIMPRLHYYRGHIELRIRLGRFLATRYMRPEEDVYSLEEYQDMIQQSQFAGEVTTE